MVIKHPAGGERGTEREIRHPVRLRRRKWQTYMGECAKTMKGRDRIPSYWTEFKARVPLQSPSGRVCREKYQHVKTKKVNTFLLQMGDGMQQAYEPRRYNFVDTKARSSRKRRVIHRPWDHHSDHGLLAAGIAQWWVVKPDRGRLLWAENHGPFRLNRPPSYSGITALLVLWEKVVSLDLGRLAMCRIYLL